MRYIHQLPHWPDFKWNHQQLSPLLASVRHHQGKLLGKMESMGFGSRREASLQTLTLEVVKSSAIEGEELQPDQVRSSIARKLGLDVAGLVSVERHVDGVVEMMLDATQNFKKQLSAERLFGWHAALFPTGRSGLHKITVGAWRKAGHGPMQVVSGAMGKERVHFEAPGSERLQAEMKNFIAWFNKDNEMDPVLKAAVAHLWFITIHPFDDGNGRIARTIAEMQLARADNNAQRFYSMSSQIRLERKDYYDCLEKTQSGTLEITKWITWFLQCLDRAFYASEKNLEAVLFKTKFWRQHREATINERQKLMLNKMLDGFEGKMNSSKWAKITKSSADTALRDIQQLLQLDMLEKEPGGGRSTSYRIHAKTE
jgi:Fic family protein